MSRKRTEPDHREQQEDDTVTARQGLEREKRRGQPQREGPSLVEVGVQRREAERHPLNRREMQLVEPQKPRRREAVDETADDGRSHAKANLAREHACTQGAQHGGEQRHEVHRQNQIAGRPDDWRGDERAADQVLRVRERARHRVVDVRVEDVDRLVREGMDVPGERPHEQIRVRTRRHDAIGGPYAQRIREQHREDDEEQRHRARPAALRGGERDQRDGLENVLVAPVR